MYPIHPHLHTQPTPAAAAVQQRGQSERTAASPAASDDRLTLSPEARKELARLQARDREVRAHEQAHAAAAGDLALGPPTYEYVRGPDNRQYAVSGQVQIDTSTDPDDPEKNLEKAQRIQRAALAPANPSGQDLSVAADAARMAAEARRELATERGPDAAPNAEQNADAGTCAACGGNHSSEAHAGITAYASIATP
ncbi:MAG: putative metalloprotease CJM1_0395 family protein [Pseudomonadota bacterium]